MKLTLRRLYGASALLVVIAILGILAASDPRSTAADEPQRGSTEAPSTVAGFHDLVAGTTSEEQAAAMADGTVTLAEYESAIRRYYACVTDAGMTPDPKPARGLRPSTFQVIIPDADGVPDHATVDHYRVLLGGCRTSHLNDINNAWAIQQDATPPEVVASTLELLGDCMADAGVTTEVASVDELTTHIDAAIRGGPESGNWVRAYFNVCRLSAQEATGFQLP
ncbi:MAG: hypothetical protein ACSLFM_11325 [Tepidiformaceae bacterium]